MRRVLWRGSDVVVDVGLTLGTHGDVGDLAANSLFQILNVIAGFLGQILPLAGGSDIAVLAGQILHHGLCGVQSHAHGRTRWLMVAVRFETSLDRSVPLG